MHPLALPGESSSALQICSETEQENKSLTGTKVDALSDAKSYQGFSAQLNTIKSLIHLNRDSFLFIKSTAESRRQ